MMHLFEKTDSDHMLVQVGDVLYMPRGTVHQAVAQQEASTHLTISTYQNFSLGTLAQAVLHSAMEGQEEPLCLPLSLRRGLPPGFLFSHGYQVNHSCKSESYCCPISPVILQFRWKRWDLQKAYNHLAGKGYGQCGQCAISDSEIEMEIGLEFDCNRVMQDANRGQSCAQASCHP